MKNIALVLLFCLTTATTKAQISFIKGYIINEKQDTLKGEVKLNPKKEYDNYSKVFFKDESGTQKNYKANKLKGYGFENQHYMAMDYDGESKFYKALVQGEISLYKMMFEVVNMNATSYDSEYYLSRKSDKKLTPVKEGKFKKQIQDLMSGASGYANDYDGDKKLNEEKAIEIINKYNNRTN